MTLIVQRSWILKAKTAVIAGAIQLNSYSQAKTLEYIYFCAKPLMCPRQYDISPGAAEYMIGMCEGSMNLLNGLAFRPRTPGNRRFVDVRAAALIAETQTQLPIQTVHFLRGLFQVVY